jgi:hypothetical protein
MRGCARVVDTLRQEPIDSFLNEEREMDFTVRWERTRNLLGAYTIRTDGRPESVVRCINFVPPVLLSQPPPPGKALDGPVVEMNWHLPGVWWQQWVNMQELCKNQMSGIRRVKETQSQPLEQVVFVGAFREMLHIWTRKGRSGGDPSVYQLVRHYNIIECMKRFTKPRFTQSGNLLEQFWTSGYSNDDVSYSVYGGMVSPTQPLITVNQIDAIRDQDNPKTSMVELKLGEPNQTMCEDMFYQCIFKGIDRIDYMEEAHCRYYLKGNCWNRSCKLAHSKHKIIGSPGR